MNAISSLASNAKSTFAKAKTVSFRALERALPIVAAAYAERFGVEIVLNGTEAKTNGQVIWLPALTDPSMADVLFGYLAHEAGHVRTSHFGMMGQCQSDTERSLFNLIEDVRIEAEMESAFPGTKETLTAMADHIVDEGMVSPAETSQNESSQLFNYLYHRLFHDVLGRESSLPLLVQSEEAIKQTFPKGFLTRLDVLIELRARSMGSTKDALLLVRAILNALQEAEREEQQQQQEQGDNGTPPPQPENSTPDSPGESGEPSDQSAGDGADQNQGQGQGASQGQGDTSDDSQGDQSSGEGQEGESADNSDADDQGSGQGQGADSEQAESGTEGQPADGTGDGSSGQPSSSSSGGEQGQGAGDETPMHTRMMSESDLPRDAVKQMAAALTTQAKQEPAAKESGPFQLSTDSVGDAHTKEGDVETLKEGVQASSVIRARLTGLLAAQSRRSDTLHTRGRKIDGRRITKTLSGDQRVFRQRHDITRPDTAVHVLLDCSGSMAHIQHIANQATVSLGLAVTAIPQCDIAISMFPGVNGEVSPVIKRGQGIRQSLGRCAISPNGGTPLAEAMLYGARELATSRKARKVLIIITDGDPRSGGAVRYMNSVIEEAVDVYAIGIMSNAVENYFKNSVVINSVGELQGALFDVAGKFLNLK